MFEAISNAFKGFQHRLLLWRRVPPIFFILPLLLGLGWIAWTYLQGVDLFQEPTYEQIDAAMVAQGLISHEEVDTTGMVTPYSTGKIYQWIRGGVIVWLLASILGWVLSLIRWPTHIPLKSVASLCLVAAVIVVGDDIYQNWEGARESFIGEEASFPAYLGKIGLIFALLVSPAFALVYYARSSIMDRYLIRNVAQPLAFCFAAFLAIWLIIDLSDHGPSFIDAGVPFHKVLWFYLIQVPMIVVQVLPVTVLLSLLYALGRMSRSNEIISMLGAGKSVGQVLRPAFISGIYLSLVCFALNYYWAPMAEGRKDSMYRAIKEGYEDDTIVDKQFYRNRAEQRSWYIGEIPFDLREDKLRNVWVQEQDAMGQPTRTIVAKSARWWPPSGPWRFYNAKTVEYEYTGDGRITQNIVYYDEKESEVGDKFDMHLPETPWRIFSSSFDPEYLGVPELTSYINTNSSLPPEQLAPFRTFRQYRMAYPWSCLVVVLLAAPLGLVFSRRGLLGGVAACVFLFFAMFFVDNLFLAMGQGNQIGALLGSWASNLIFTVIGAILLFIRTRNWDFPTPKSIWNNLFGKPI